MPKYGIFSEKKCWDAIFRLAARQPLDNLNADMVCREVGFGRSTFYYHYSSVGAFLIHACSEKLMDILFTPSMDQATFGDCMNCIDRLISEEEEAVLSILHSRYQTKITKILRQTFLLKSREIFRRLFEEGSGPYPSNFSVVSELYAQIMCSTVEMSLTRFSDQASLRKRCFELTGAMLDQYAEQMHRSCTEMQNDQSDSKLAEKPDILFSYQDQNQVSEQTG